LFIFGLTRRTGTHYLEALLELHPQCVPISVPTNERVSRPEDYLLDHADPLRRYVAELRSIWDPAWNYGADADQALLDELVRAIARFVVAVDPRTGTRADDPSWVVTKTPSTRNLSLLIHALPDLPILVITRDGRDVAESGHSSFGLSYERWIRLWLGGVEHLRAAQAIDQHKSLHVVRYESLIEDLRPTMSKVLAHLGLDEAAYDWDAAASVPVRGSSMIRGDRTKVTWAAFEDKEGLIGRARWQSWPRHRLARFAHLAGPQMIELGYDIGAEPEMRLINKTMDIAWTGARAGRTAATRLVGAYRSLAGKSVAARSGEG
jgi:hypothetical protein